MHTQCPQCNTIFNITDDQLNAANGKVRCSHCDKIFFASDQLFEHNAEQPSAVSLDQGLDFDAEAEQNDTQEDSLETALDGTKHLRDTTRTQHKPISVNDLLAEHKSYRRPLIWTPLIILLVLIALVPLTWLGRSNLVQYKEGRQLLEFICKFAGCQLPARSATEKIEILSRIVVEHPKKENTLGILLTIRNKAPFPQPYPTIKITLHDMREEMVTSRLYKPEEYLGETYSSSLSFQPGENLDIEMELEDPGENVSGFRFDFL